MDSRDFAYGGLFPRCQHFGVIGLADVVFRSTTQLYNLIQKASSAPESAAQLLGVVQSLASVIVEVRIWAAEYEQSGFAQDDGQRVSDDIENALSRCPEMAGSIDFALSETQIHQAIKMVVYHQTSLKTLMQVRGGRDNIILRRKIDHLEALSSSNSSNISTMRDVVQKIEKYHGSTITRALEMRSLLERIDVQTQAFQTF